MLFEGFVKALKLCPQYEDEHVSKEMPCVGPRVPEEAQNEKEDNILKVKMSAVTSGHKNGMREKEKKRDR